MTDRPTKQGRGRAAKTRDTVDWTLPVDPAALRTTLLDWYDRHRRTLPWRASPGEHSDPYAVWLSEIMLQQTTVAAVKGYFERFLERWPTVGDLAAADRDDVLNAWAGLGYYARARNLHRCAAVVADDHDGHFPSSVADLKALPGVGEYTSAAIAAIAFDTPATVVDGNVERVITRLFALETPLPDAKPDIRIRTGRIAPDTAARRPGDFAQAMMDLGATVCTSRAPKCLLCPWRDACRAHAMGEEGRFPLKKPKKPKPSRRCTAFWVTSGDHVLLERRPAKGLLGGMPGLFSTPWVDTDTQDMADDWQSHLPLSGNTRTLPGTTRHTFTHFHLETRVIAVSVKTVTDIENGFWIPFSHVEEAGLPTVFKKMAVHAVSNGSGT